MKANVDQETCIGCGLCASTCPEVFEMRGDVAYVKVEPVPPESEQACREACDGCPVAAITLEG
ncbi:MAG: ferredoxin [Kiritimatiellia bacterium]|jgi:ferredoxin|nr:ferredoxin [Kiritimatiellia bacterium]